MQTSIYDCVIIGGGPAGYTGALYCARAGLSVLVLEQMTPGGQMATTGTIDNYPGFADGIDGFQLGEQMQKGAHRFGVQTKFEKVTAVDLAKDVKTITTDRGVWQAKTVMLATGAVPRLLGLESETRLRGRGVSYCATCDGMFFKDKTVAVIGGGNSAAEDALFLSKVCKKVYLVHRRDTLRATKVYQTALEHANVTFLWNSRVCEILGDQQVTGIQIADGITGEQQNIDCDGVFVAIGRDPDTALFKAQIKTDNAGYIIADETTKTNLPGVFAIGDVRTKPLRQVVTAAADGAVASKFVEEFLTTGEHV